MEFLELDLMDLNGSGCLSGEMNVQWAILQNSFENKVKNTTDKRKDIIVVLSLHKAELTESLQL